MSASISLKGGSHDPCKEEKYYAAEAVEAQRKNPCGGNLGTYAFDSENRLCYREMKEKVAENNLEWACDEDEGEEYFDLTEIEQLAQVTNLIKSGDYKTQHSVWRDIKQSFLDQETYPKRGQRMPCGSERNPLGQKAFSLESSPL